MTPKQIKLLEEIEELAWKRYHKDQLFHLREKVVELKSTLLRTGLYHKLLLM